MFLGRLPAGPITQSAGYAERLARFARLQPENAWANYYYAEYLWKRREGNVQPLLEKAVRQDPRLGEALLLLGVIFAEQSKWNEAITAYQKAIAANPKLPRRTTVWRRHGGQPASR